MVVGQTTPHMRNLLSMETELANDASGITDGEDSDGMAFAAGTLGAAGAMADGALQQGATKDVAGIRESREEAVSLLGGLLVVHH